MFCATKTKKRPTFEGRFSGTACNSLNYKQYFLVAWGGIEPPTRGFSIPAEALHYFRFVQQIKDLQRL